MKSILFSVVLIGLVTLVSCSGESVPEYPDATPEQQPIVDSVLGWLPHGDHLAYLMSGQSGGKRTEELSLKMASSVRMHETWFIEYSQNFEPGQQLPYHENLGLTKEEYDELFNNLENIKLSSPGSMKISVLRDGDVLSFDAKGPFEGLNFLKIDARALVAHLNLMDEGNVTLKLSDTLDVPGVTNPYGNPWHAYVWSYQEGEFPDEISNFAATNVKSYKLILGYVENVGKVMLTIEIKKVENGIQTADVTLPLLIDRAI